MARFVFRLQTVYELRVHEENDQKDRLAAERRKLEELHEYLERLEREVQYWSEYYIKQSKQGISPRKAAEIYHYLDEINRLIDEFNRKAEFQQSVVERERLELIEKMKERKIIESLKEKQAERFFAEEQKKQEIEVEELVINGRLSVSWQ